MSRTIAVLGATGVYGRHLLPRLQARGHRVRALVRRPSPDLPDARAADIFDGESLRRAIDGCDVVINLATSVPRPDQKPDYAMNDRIRQEGTATLIAACRAVGTRRLIQQGIAMVHAGGGEALLDESTAPRSGPATRSAIDMEAMLRDSGLSHLILRGGLFYGPGTGREAQWLAAARDGSLTVPGDGSDFVSLIHVADMAEATALALDAQGTLLVVDDHPVRWRDLFAHVAKLAGASAPKTGAPVRLPSFRCANAAARAALGWRPFYADYRSGLAV